MKNKKVIGLIALLSLGLASCQAPNYPFGNPIIEQHKLTFLDANGEVILEDHVYNHQNYVYKGEIPTKEQTEIYTYTFTGWDKELNNITSDTTFKPVFEETRRTYTITYLDGNDEVIWTDSVEAEGESVYDGPNPTKDPDPLHSYEFNGEWLVLESDVTESTLDNVLGNMTVQAQFNQTARKHVVRFFSEDGTILLDQIEVIGGEYATWQRQELPSKPDEISADGETKTVYTFAGWDKPIDQTPILEATNFRAKFTSQVVKSDKVVVREYIQAHKEDRYEQNGYDYMFIETGYYLGYSETKKDFSLRVEKEGIMVYYLPGENNIQMEVRPQVTLTVSFDYNNVGAKNAYFTYRVHDTIGTINTSFILSCFGKPPMLEANGSFDHNGAETDEKLKGYVNDSDRELRYTINSLSNNLNNFFIRNDLPYLY